MVEFKEKMEGLARGEAKENDLIQDNEQRESSGYNIY
jgi:hypothetical protein